MLAAIVLYLSTIGPTTVPRMLGMAAHGWLLDWVRQQDPGLADRLHQANALRPFTVSDVVWNECLPPGLPYSRAEVPAGFAGRLRITSLDPALSRLLATRRRSLLERPLRLDEVDLTATGMAVSPAEHREAGSIGRLDLLRMAAPPVPEAGIDLRFVSPTVFRQNKRDVYLPEPRLVFGSWLQRWNAFAIGDALPEALVEEFEQRVTMVRCDIRPRTVLHKGRVVGGIGSCRYLLPADQQLREIAIRLAATSFWSGTGRSTAWGLGQTRPGNLVTSRLRALPESGWE